MKPTLFLIFTVLCLTATAAVPATTTRPSAASTQPMAVPYRLTDANHLMVRLKLNGKGPFNFILDTGAPTLILRDSAAAKVGLHPSASKMATIMNLDIEGGLSLKKVKCIVETPYQIEAMNAIGASGVELDGMVGYTVLARFRMQIDLSKDKMVWTPLQFIPPPLFTRGQISASGPADAFDKNEDSLESTGSLFKVLGPLIKQTTPPPTKRGFVGIELHQGAGPEVLKVLGDSPAEKAGVHEGDVIKAVDGKSVSTVKDVQTAVAKLLVGKTLKLTVTRDGKSSNLSVVAGEGL